METIIKNLTNNGYTIKSTNSMYRVIDGFGINKMYSKSDLIELNTKLSQVILWATLLLK